MYRAIITDLDGTVVKISSDGSDAREADRLAVQQAQERNYKIACATGRSWYLAKPIIERLGITEACIVEGGTRIVNPVTEETLWEKHLGNVAIAQVFSIFKKFGSAGELLTHDDELRAPMSKITIVPRKARIMYLLGIEPEEALTVCREINQTAVAVGHTTISWSGGDKLDVHVTHPEATKEHAIQVWQHLEQVTKAETIGMGDSCNDIPLFKSAGLKVAVANATDDLKPLADYIAPTYSDGPLEHVINEFLLSQSTT